MTWVDINPIPRHPVWTPKQAVAFAKSEVKNPDKNYRGMCLHFCAWSYGFEASGVHDAYRFWKGLPKRWKHPGDRKPPTGSLVFWSGGSKGYGHIAIVVGQNSNGEFLIASNDIRRSGKIDIVPLGLVEKKWGQTYLGWAPPYFQFGDRDNRPAPSIYKNKYQHGNVYVSRLRKGAKSISVGRLQHRLGMKVNNTYGAGTVAAVKKWQNAHGWERANGEVITNEQANRLFGANYFVKQKP